MVELVDTRDLKSLGPKTVRVRFPLAAPLDSKPNTVTVIGIVFIQTRKHALP